MSAHPWHVAGLRIGVCALLLSAARLTAVAPRQLAAPDDQRIRTQIEARLMDEGFLGVSVDVHGHVATLTGSITTLADREQAIEQVHNVPLVVDVVDMTTIPPGDSDESIAMEIAEDVGNSSYYTVFDDVTVQVAKGTAMLTGFVTTPVTSRHFVQAASKVPGVQRIINTIETLPPSMNDAQVRYAIGTAIYGGLFPQYASAHNGPIHIIVNLGHVTLTGVASSHVDRRMAEVFARGTFGVVSVENRIAVETED